MGGCEPALPGYSYDPDRARSELREAGYGPGLEPIARLPELTLYFNSRPPGPVVAQAVQADFQRIGLRVRLRALDLAALLEATNQQEPDLFRLAWVADFPDADSFLRIFHSSMPGAAGNRARLFGLNAVGLKRHHFPETTISALKQAYRVIFRSHMTLTKAIEKVQAEVSDLPEIRHLLDFLKNSKRGICR
jgi:ABC-type transport system substrate-binding protein